MRKGCSSKVDVRRSFITRKLSVLSLFSHVKVGETAPTGRRAKPSVLSRRQHGYWFVFFFPRKKISEFFFSSLCILPFDASSNKKATRWHTLWEVLKRKIQSQDHIKARVTRLTAAVRSVRPLFFLLVSLGDKIFPNMSGIISHCIVCAPPPPLQTPLFFTVWRAALTINMSLCGRGCVSEEGSE